MARWRKKRQPSRADLIERKHQLEGEIRALAAEVRRRKARGGDAGELEARLARLRSRHHETRLDIDRTSSS